MPKLLPSEMAQRRQSILRAARRCFARKGFHATTVADLCAEAGISAGGLYTHFESKHAVVAALGSDASERTAALDLVALFRQLQAPAGLESARLDLQLWSAALGDPELSGMVQGSMDAFRDALATHGDHSPGWIQLLEALALGLEVQRALGRPVGAGLEAEVTSLTRGGSDD